MIRRVVTALGLASVACTGATRPTPEPEPKSTPAAVLSPPDLVKSPTAELKATIDSMVADARFRSAFWGILIVNPETNDTLYSLNAGKLFLPASNMKIVTASAALTDLGPDYRYRTTFAAHGKIDHGVLHGDLVVIGRGDPTVSDHMMHDAMIPLRAAADSAAAHGSRSAARRCSATRCSTGRFASGGQPQLRPPDPPMQLASEYTARGAMVPILAAADSVATHGIHRITGHVVQGGDAFPDANVGYGWDWDDLSEPYAAGVDELMFNEGFTTVIVHGGARPGAAATVATAPAVNYPTLRNHARTVAPTGDALSQPITVAYDTASGSLVVNGTVAPNDSTVVQISYRDPAGAYLSAFASALSTQHVALRANAVDRAVDSSGALDTLFTLLSPPLRDILPALLKPSQNQIAEILLKTVGLEKTGVGSADSGARVIHDQLILWGAAPDGFVLHDGSGLSRHDYLSPQTIVRILMTMRRDPAFQVFYDALPIAGVDGTIGDRMRGTMAAGNVRAKTGFVDKARSLSGYVTTADGTPLVFSFLCNNWTTPVRDVEHVQDEIAARLAAMTLDRR